MARLVTGLPLGVLMLKWWVMMSAGAGAAANVSTTSTAAEADHRKVDMGFLFAGTVLRFHTQVAPQRRIRPTMEIATTVGHPSRGSWIVGARPYPTRRTAIFSGT